jgi:hypothetical protein
VRVEKIGKERGGLCVYVCKAVKELAIMMIDAGGKASLSYFVRIGLLSKLGQVYH